MAEVTKGKTETYAEITFRTNQRDDLHMIFEWYQIFQFVDGSVFVCERDMETSQATYAAQDIVDGKHRQWECATNELTKMLHLSLMRNAKAALKYGKTHN